MPRGRPLLPGFINAHTHSVLTVLRGTVEDMGGDAIIRVHVAHIFCNDLRKTDRR